MLLQVQEHLCYFTVPHTAVHCIRQDSPRVSNDGAALSHSVCALDLLTLTVLTSWPSRYSVAMLFFSMPLLITNTRWCHWPSAISSPQRKRAQQGRIS